VRGRGGGNAHATPRHRTCHQLEHVLVLLGAEAQLVKHLQQLLKHLLVVQALHRGAARLRRVPVVLRPTQRVPLPQVGGHAGQRDEVKDVVVALLGRLEHDAALLQQVVDDLAAADLRPAVEVHLHPLAEPRRVVVPQRLGVAERLQDGVGGEQAVLQPAALAGWLGAAFIVSAARCPRCTAHRRGGGGGRRDRWESISAPASGGGGPHRRIGGTSWWPPSCRHRSPR